MNGKIKLLDEKWNVQVANIFCKSSKTKTPYIIHYIGSNKPWMKNSWNMYKTYYFKYVFIPARKNRKVDEIRYISKNYVKAVQVKKDKSIVVYYYFVRENNEWLVHIPEL